MNPKLRIGITLGDINGIGPELVIKLFQDQRMKEICTPVLYGSSRVLNVYRKQLEIEKFQYHVVTSASQAQPKRLNIIECVADQDRVEPGKPTEAAGRAAYQALKRAIEDAQHQEIDALVTLPVDKSTLEISFPTFKGHTEMLADAFNVPENLMLMVADSLRVGLITNHVPIQEVASQVTVERILTKTRILHRTLRQDFNVLRPVIALLGLNPHAGDRGLLGKEEDEVIRVAIAQLAAEGILVTGPYPADGFFGALTYRKFDGILAMYHDQGLIPFKLLAGFEGVNVTAGMPIVRTSPDHGVAYDIAGQGVADDTSFRKALYLAIDIHTRRIENQALEAGALVLSEELEKKKH